MTEYLSEVINPDKPGSFMKDTKEKYKGCTAISGNFETYSHTFNVYIDDEELINEFTEAIRKNQATEEYKAAKKRLEECRQMEHEKLVARLERNKRK